MKKVKVVLSMFLVAALICTLFAACSTSGKNDGTTNSQGTKPEEIVDIVVATLDLAGNPTSEWDRMANYCNTILEPQGIRVSFIIGEMGDYGTTIPMMIAGGEKLDVVNILPIGGTHLSVLMSNNSLKDIHEEAAKYCPKTIEISGDALKAYKKGDALYGFPTNRLNTSNEYAILRKDILEACGLVEAAENCSTWSDLEAIFAGVYDYVTENHIYVIGGQRSVVPLQAIWTGNEFSTGEQLDDAGDTTGLISIDQKTGKVFSKYENEYLLNMMKRGNTWNEKGWVFPDTVLGDDHVYNLMKQGVIFCNWNHTELGVEVARKLSSGFDVVCPMTCPGIVCTGNLSFGVGIPVNCDDVEAACKFIEALYTDERISTVFSWGIEGEDYVMVNGEADYTDPKSNFHASDFIIGNQMIMPPWQGTGADFRERSIASNKAAKCSRFVGLAIDASEMASEVSALTSVKDEYLPALTSGLYSDENYKKFLDKAYASGLQEYMDGVQKQVDAFLAENE